MEEHREEGANWEGESKQDLSPLPSMFGSTGARKVGISTDFLYFSIENSEMASERESAGRGAPAQRGRRGPPEPDPTGQQPADGVYVPQPPAALIRALAPAPQTSLQTQQYNYLAPIEGVTQQIGQQPVWQQKAQQSYPPFHVGQQAMYAQEYGQQAMRAQQAQSSPLMHQGSQPAQIAQPTQGAP